MSTEPTAHDGHRSRAGRSEPTTRGTRAPRRTRAARRRHGAAGLAALALVALAACSGGDDDAAETFDAPAEVEGALSGDDLLAADDSAGEAAEPGDAAMPEVAEAPASTGGDESTVGSVGTAGFDVGNLGRDVVVEMRVTMRSDDIRATVAGIMQAASAGDGGVAASDVDYGSDQRPGRATIVVKVPPAALDSLIERLGTLGEVTAIGQDATDVTDQLTDLEVRIRNAEQSVDRVRALLADATDLREVIELESELTRRQTDLERLLASQRNLQERVALATVTIDVLPVDAPEVAAAESDPGVVDGLRRGWDGLVAAVGDVAYGAATIWPLLVVALIALGAGWRVVRSRRDATNAGVRTAETGPVSADAPASPPA